MSVTKEQVISVASLARLAFDDDEQDALAVDLNKILTYVELLNVLDTEDVEPTAHVLQIVNTFRCDNIEFFNPRRELKANAPSSEDSLFKVPRVID